MAAPQYTTCVQPQDYKHPNLPGGSMSTWGDIYSILSSGGLGFIKRLCHYLLHGKLVCLGGDKCAIGRMAAFNTVDDKSGFEKLDNDFGIRIVLCPTSLSLMERGESNRVPNHNKAILGPQGELIKEQPNMPNPRDPGSGSQPSSKFKGVYVGNVNNTSIFGVPASSADWTYYIPVLHCEIEGDRIAFVCAALSIFSHPVLEAFCSIPLIGWITCWIITLVSLPAIAAVAASAWLAGSNDHRDFDKAASLTAGDTVVITGRWVYDAGHEGWNELHPVKSVQKIVDQNVCDVQNFEEYLDRWCSQTMQVPPPRRPGSTDRRPSGMSPEQETVWEEQVKPENRWIFHPIVDGCDIVRSETRREAHFDGLR